MSSATGDGGERDVTHIFVSCRTPEDASRVDAASAQMAQADTPLRLHTDRATLPPAAVPAFDPAACTSALAGRTHALGRVVLAAAELGSTQELMRTHGSALGDGAVAVADRQTTGKGRGGNTWTSPPGCLMFSCLRRLRVQSAAQAPFVNYLVCLAVTRGVREATQGLAPLDIRIKWPNDIYAAGVKIAGALIHTTWQGNSFNVITGIGLNVNNRQPTTCLDELLERAAAGQQGGAAVASSAPAPAPLRREAVLAAILAAMEDVFDTFEAHGFGTLEPEYLASWMHSGQVLEFEDGPAAPALAGGAALAAAAGPATLTVRGLSPAGFLLGEDAAGGRYELTPDGNSLDMMRGLLRRKVN